MEPAHGAHICVQRELRSGLSAGHPHGIWSVDAAQQTGCCATGKFFFFFFFNPCVLPYLRYAIGSLAKNAFLD